MKLFSEGQYLHAAEERAMADAISQVLYPEDNHYEGKSLRLKSSRSTTPTPPWSSPS